MAKAKAFITRHPAWTTIFIVLFAGLFMGAKWLEPQPDVMDGAQFSAVQRGNLRVTVAEGGALDSTSKLNLKCELDNGGTIVSLVAEGLMWTVLHNIRSAKKILSNPLLKNTCT